MILFPPPPLTFPKMLHSLNLSTPCAKIKTLQEDKAWKKFGCVCFQGTECSLNCAANREFSQHQRAGHWLPLGAVNPLFLLQPTNCAASNLLLRVRRTAVFVKQTFQKHLILCHIDPNVLWERHVHILFSLKHPILANPRDQKKPRVQHFFFETEDFCCKSKHRWDAVVVETFLFPPFLLAR